jgi:hypothetical protein
MLTGVGAPLSGDVKLAAVGEAEPVAVHAALGMIEPV